MSEYAHSIRTELFNERADTSILRAKNILDLIHENKSALEALSNGKRASKKPRLLIIIIKMCRLSPPFVDQRQGIKSEDIDKCMKELNELFIHQLDHLIHSFAHSYTSNNKLFTYVCPHYIKAKKVSSNPRAESEDSAKDSALSNLPTKYFERSNPPPIAPSGSTTEEI